MWCPILVVNQGIEIFFAIWEQNQDVKIFCEIRRFSGLPPSPRRMESIGQAPDGGPGGRAPGSSKVLAISKDQNQHFEAQFLFLRFCYCYYPILFLPSVIFFWERRSRAPVDFEALWLTSIHLLDTHQCYTTDVLQCTIHVLIARLKCSTLILL